MLSERALELILLLEDDFPYTIHVESTITQSNAHPGTFILLFASLHKFVCFFWQEKILHSF